MAVHTHCEEVSEFNSELAKPWAQRPDGALLRELAEDWTRDKSISGPWFWTLQRIQKPSFPESWLPSVTLAWGILLQHLPRDAHFVVEGGDDLETLHLALERSK
jgi:hypothetical protein